MFQVIGPIISPLPFYSSLAEQNHRRAYSFGAIYSLVTYRNMLMPFQVCLKGWAEINSVFLHSLSGTTIDITNYIPTHALQLKEYENLDIRIIQYFGLYPLSIDLSEGQYYIEITLDNEEGNLQSIYSEVFTVTNNIDNCIQVEYSNSYNFELQNSIIDFSDNFIFKCYLCTQIGKPEYVFEEEVTERMGYSFIESQVSKKIYKFTFVAPEYLCDALRIVRLCENKQISSNRQVYDLTTFNMEPSWEEQGDLAAVECTFETDTVIANAGGYLPVPLGGDFNNDHNVDFSIN